MATLLLLLACAGGPIHLAPLPADGMANDPDALGRVVDFLAHPSLGGRDEGSAGSAAARAFLVGQLERCGVEPAGETGFFQPIRTGRGTNVVGRIRGRGAGHTVVLSAHYDHQDGGLWTHPGATDNATAVAAVLRVACRLAVEPAATDVVVAFWDAEEPPTFRTSAMGSRYWHAHPTVPLDAVSAVVVLDILGTGLWDGHDGVFALGAETSPELTAAVDATPAPAGLRPTVAGLHLVEEMVVGRRMAWSDYETFRDGGLPVLFLTDGQNRRYHTPADTADAVDRPKLRRETAWTEALVRRIGSGPRPAFRPALDLDRDREAVRALVRAAVDSGAAAAWGDVAHDALVQSLDAVDRSGDGRGQATPLRRAAQRLMCWAGSSASVFTCGML